MKGRSAIAVLCVLLGCGADDDDASGGAGAAASGGAGAGAAGAVAGSGGGAVTFVQIQAKLNEACNCHQSTPILMAPFSLKVGEAYGNLVGAASVQLPSMQRVKPGSLEQSYLWHKINDTQLQVGGSGLIMPSNIPLRSDEIDLFARWIAAGAPP